MRIAVLFAIWLPTFGLGGSDIDDSSRQGRERAENVSWPQMGEKSSLEERVLAPFNGLLGNLLP